MVDAIVKMNVSFTEPFTSCEMPLRCLISVWKKPSSRGRVLVNLLVVLEQLHRCGSCRRCDVGVDDDGHHRSQLDGSAPTASGVNERTGIGELPMPNKKRV
jgi:hypothetical protein